MWRGEFTLETVTLALVTACPSERTRPLIDPSLLLAAGAWANACVEQAQTHAANNVACKNRTRRRLPSIMTIDSGRRLRFRGKIQRKRCLSNYSVAGCYHLPCGHPPGLQISVNANFIITRRHSLENKLSARVNARVGDRQRTTGTNKRGVDLCARWDRAALDTNSSADYSGAVTKD